MITIRELTKADVPGVKALTDHEIGKDYYSLSELTNILGQSIQSRVNCSFVLVDQQKVVGVRLTYPPGNWQSGKGQSLNESRWPHPLAQTAYFQSLFIHGDYQRQGWGKKMSYQSIEQLKKLETKGVVCHSWKESPGRSSASYLTSMGFTLIAEYPEYWKEVDYTCPRCGRPCLCTAQEMYLDLQG